MSSTLTCLPLGALSMPAMSRMDLVFARTMMVPSGMADQTPEALADLDLDGTTPAMRYHMNMCRDIGVLGAHGL